MTDDLDKLGSWLAPLLKNLDAGQRRKLMRNVARDMRQRNQRRIRQQVDPDGDKFEPRARQKAGGIKRRAMFTKLRTARWLKTNTSPEHAAVEWAGRVARVASIHHHGERARVSKDGPMHDYPERRLLGFAREDHAAITDLILEHLSEGLH